MGKKTTKKSETDAEGRKKMVEAAEELLQTKYADLAGSDVMKCRDEALLEDVRKKMGWDYAPGGQFLFDEVRDSRARANAPEPEKPKRRAPRRRRSPSPSPPPPAKRSEPEPAPAKPVPLANQDLNQDESGVAAADSSSELDQLRAAVEQAEKARKGETESRVKSDPRPKACKMRRVGDKKWRRFKTRKDAAAAFPGISAAQVSDLCNGKGTTTLSAQFEARDADEGVSMSKRDPYAAVLSGAGFRFNTADVGSDAGALEVALRGAWGRSPPRSWEAALKRFGEFSEEDWRKFVAATGEAEAERVDKLRSVLLRESADPALAAKRQAGTAGHDGGYVDPDFDIERAEREDREADLDRLRETDAPRWMQRVAEDEIKARRRRAWWREQKQRVGSPNDYFASL